MASENGAQNVVTTTDAAIQTVVPATGVGVSPEPKPGSILGGLLNDK